MFNPRELLQLNSWCARRQLFWSPASSPRKADAVRLFGGNWSGLLVAKHMAELAVFTAAGVLLASASDLPALLDALDAGVAGDYIVPMAYALRGSTSLWKSPGSAST